MNCPAARRCNNHAGGELQPKLVGAARRVGWGRSGKRSFEEGVVVVVEEPGTENGSTEGFLVQLAFLWQV